jgi:hypothetical protein
LLELISLAEPLVLTEGPVAEAAEAGGVLAADVMSSVRWRLERFVEPVGPWPVRLATHAEALARLAEECSGHAPTPGLARDIARCRVALQDLTYALARSEAR